MKKIRITLINILFLTLLSGTLFAQTPGQFKYQAVLRDATGNIIVNQQKTIVIDILKGSTTGTSVFTESHTITTTAQGLINLNIGSVNTTGISLIDWSTDKYFIKLKVEGVEMGTSQLLAVPYALNAKWAESTDFNKITNKPNIFSGIYDDLINKPNIVSSQWASNGSNIYYNLGNVGIGNMTPTGKLVVQGSVATGSLFEVKDVNGNVVFAVYPDSVQIVLPVNPGGKPVAGGFTVSGRTGSKAPVYSSPFLRVTPNSTTVEIGDSTQGFKVINAQGGKFDLMRLTSQNYFIGHNSGISTTGLQNLFFGYEAGKSNIGGGNNSFIGYHAGYLNSSGNYNVFIGNEAGYDNSTYDYNTYIGYQAGYNAKSNYNTAVGYQAGYSQTNWQAGTFLGFEAGKNTTGRQNVFLGASTGNAFTTGSDNVCIGAGAGGSNDSPFVPATGTANVFIGYYTGYKPGAASNNVIIGQQSPFGTTLINGSRNVYIGDNAGNQSNAGSDNVFIGYNAGLNESGSNKLYIDNSSTATPLIYGDFTNGSEKLRVNGNLGINSTPNMLYALNISLDANDTYALVAYGPTYCTSGVWAGSDIRFKKNIVNLTNSLDKVLALNGVSFEWNIDEFPEKGFAKGKSIGFLAQDVEKIFPEFVTHGPDGYKAVAYDKMTAVLVEAIKEQQQLINELKTANNQQQTTINELKCKLDEQGNDIKLIKSMLSQSK